MRRKKILEICNFSSGISGVWTRVLEEAKILSKENEVWIFSSNLKNEYEKVKSYGKIGRIKIRRFPVKFRIGYALFFNFYKEALKLKPDIIVAHGFRKPYLNQVISAKKELEKEGKKIKIFLVTHAPFLEKGLRNKFTEFIVKFYDFLYGKKILNSFDKVMAITKWEIPLLLKLGCEKEKIVYIPNTIPEEFFKQKKGRAERKILFFGRINRIKNLETLILACSKLKHSRNYRLDITGPADEKYLGELKNLARKLKVNVKFSEPIYDLRERIKKIDSCEIFVLPSKREGLPLSIVEAMAREKIVVSSNTQGGKELIKNGENGFLFKIGDYNELSRILKFCLNEKNSKQLKKIKENARKKAGEYSKKNLNKIEKIISEK